MGRRRTASAPGDLERGRQKGGFKEAFDVEVVREIEALIAPGAADRLDFEAVETAARRRALSVAARAVEQRLNADHCDHVGPHLLCPRGHQAHYAGRRDKTFTTALGDMALGRAYYHCEECEAGFCPARLCPGTCRYVAVASSGAHEWASSGNGQLRRNS